MKFHVLLVKEKILKYPSEKKKYLKLMRIKVISAFFSAALEVRRK